MGNQDSSVSYNVQALADRLDLVETQLTDLKKTNVVPVVIDSESELNQQSAFFPSGC